MSVYTSSAVPGIAVVSAPADAEASGAWLRLAVAIPPETTRLLSRVPAGIAEESPAARSAAFGPASSALTAAVAGIVDGATERSATPSLPSRRKYSDWGIVPGALGDVAGDPLRRDCDGPRGGTSPRGWRSRRT